MEGHLGCFSFLAIRNKAVINIYRWIFVLTQVFISVGQMASSVISCSYDRFMFNFFNDCPTAFQSDCVFHSQQQCVHDPVSPHLRQHLMLLLFFILDILIGV